MEGHTIPWETTNKDGWMEVMLPKRWRSQEGIHVCVYIIQINIRINIIVINHMKQIWLKIGERRKTYTHTHTHTAYRTVHIHFKDYSKAHTHTHTHTCVSHNRT